jgi:hypothetical protein
MIAASTDDSNICSGSVRGRQPSEEQHAPASDRDRSGVLDRRGERAPSACSARRFTGTGLRIA